MQETEYERIVRVYTDTVYRVALSYTKRAEDAEDVTQTVFLKLFTKEVVFRDEDHIRKWLIRVAVNESKNLWMSFWQRNVHGFSGEQEEPVFSTEEKSDLYDAVMYIPKKYRIVIHLFYYEGYSAKEIAGILHIGEAAVRTRLVRGRKHLKERLKEAWKDEK